MYLGVITAALKMIVTTVQECTLKKFHVHFSDIEISCVKRARRACKLDFIVILKTIRTQNKDLTNKRITNNLVVYIGTLD